MLTVSEYMALRCLCGAPRSEHAHAYEDFVLPDGTFNPTPTRLRVVGVSTTCPAFTWERERELGGNPLSNPHLGPLMREGD
jgi:hypothetical protein